MKKYDGFVHKTIEQGCNTFIY